MPRPRLTFLDAPVPYKSFWKPLLTDCFIQDLRAIEGDLQGLDILPRPEFVLRFLQTERVKGVVLGQDPYSTPGKATGRAFEVGDLYAWRDCPSDSVLEILKALYRFSRGKEGKLEKKGIIADDKFVILQPNQLFEHWENEGILLLNTALTCSPKKPGSHLALWAPIVNKVVRFLRTQASPPFWFLWGEEAQAYDLLLPGQVVHREVHPSPQGKTRGEFFSDTATCFGKEPIDWLGITVGASAITEHPSDGSGNNQS